jgi:uncharacterized iron-regulated membrane protein
VVGHRHTVFRRPLWVRLHRYAGLYMAFFLIVAGLTGSVLAFHPQIDRWLNPPVRLPLRGGPALGAPLDVFELRERALAMEPRARIPLIDFTRNAEEPYIAQLEPRTDPRTGEIYALPYDELTLNPYSGKLLSHGNSDGNSLWPITRGNFLRVMLMLHYSLAIPGSIGLWLFGIAAFIWTLDCFVGLYLTLPLTIVRQPRRPDTGMTRWRRSWRFRWKHAWVVKWRASIQRINFDLHRAGGLWTWPMLLLLAWSSVGLNLPQIYDPVMNALLGESTNPFAHLHKPAAPVPDPKLEWREAHRIGRMLVDRQGQDNGWIVAREKYQGYVPENGTFVYYVDTMSLDRKRTGEAVVQFDGATGKMVGMSLPNARNAHMAADYWLFNIHMARVGGLPMQIVVCLMGSLIAMLSITGVYLWWKKHRVRAIRRNRRSLRVRELRIQV